MCYNIFSVNTIIFSSEKFLYSVKKASDLPFYKFEGFSRVFYKEEINGVEEGALKSAFNTHIKHPFLFVFRYISPNILYIKTEICQDKGAAWNYFLRCFTKFSLKISLIILWVAFPSQALINLFLKCMTVFLS